MLKVLLQGPMKGTYSLAIVNRNIAKRLHRFCDLYLLPDELDCKDDTYFKDDGLVDFLGKDALRQYDMHLKNTWPPTTEGMVGRVNAYVNFAWEETRFPKTFVDGFNRNLDFITVTSDFTAKSLLSSGVTIPVMNTGNGIEEFLAGETTSSLAWLPSNIFNFDTRFLHVSSGFWRKGVDVLINAFLDNFKGSREACLIIKTFSNPDSIVVKELEKIPEEFKSNIFVIDNDITKEDLRQLYNIATCIVLPSRGEGFSLPSAEALAMGKPLITTRFSGALDFCNDRNSLLVDYKPIKSRTHVACAGALIADPDRADLADKLLRVAHGAYIHPSFSEQNYIRKIFNWNRAVRRTLYSAALARKKKESVDIVLITTWNQRCGLAEYSRNLVRALSARQVGINVIAPVISKTELIRKDEDYVERKWSVDASSASIYKSLLIENRSKVVILQHHLAYFSKETTISFIRYCSALNIGSIIIAHNARDWPAPFPEDVKNASQNVTIVVHDERDQEHLTSMGFKDVHLFEHPVVDSLDKTHQARHIKDDPHLTSFGFIMPHKGFQDIIHAMPIIKRFFPKCRLTLLSASQNNIKSEVTYFNLMDLISYYGLEKDVRIDTAFLETSQVTAILKASDLTLLPYQESSEGASGALRTCITAGVPLLISNSEIFSSAPSELPRFRGADPIDLAEKVIDCVKNKYRREQMSQISASIAKHRSWDALVPELYGLIRYKSKIGYFNLTEWDQNMARSSRIL
ncbi:glycosyltransferase [Methylobacterium sp. ID0610]|uniref:glycosyltransferase n=1 Tax=Methylobacterium carpenticola TaxID=3344827 RepID=UPI0036A4C191